MAERTWRGDAPAVAQVTHVTPANVEVGDWYALRINNKTIAVQAAEATVEHVVNALVTAINGSDEPEWQEVVAGAGTDDAGNVTHLVLTAATAGVPFTVEVDPKTTVQTIIVTRITQGQPAQNEQQRIALTPAPTSGTFTITYDGQTTSAIDYDATAAEVQSALEALNNISPGDVVVTGGPGPSTPWLITFTGNLAGTDVPLLSVDASGLSGSGSVIVTAVTEGLGLSDELHAIRLSFPDNTCEYRIQYLGAWSPWIPATANPQNYLEQIPGIGQGNIQVVGTCEEFPESYSSKVEAVWVIHFTGDLGGQLIDLPSIETNPVGTATPTKLQLGGQSSCTEWQWFEATENGFWLSYQGETTDVILGTEWL